MIDEELDEDMEKAYEYDLLVEQITRLQEKYDENGYSYPPNIKLNRIEQHIDAAFEIYKNKLKAHPIVTGYLNLLTEEKHKESVLVFLYTSLSKIPNDELLKSYNDFLPAIMEYSLSPDTIAHILNPLSPLKDKLSNWNNFVVYATEKLREQIGEEETQELLNVIL